MAKSKLTREFIEKLKEAIENKEDKFLFKQVKDLHASDIAEIYSGLSEEDAGYIHQLLGNELATDVLLELEEDEREEFLSRLSGEFIAKQYIENMDSDDAADIIGELPEDKQEEVLQHIDDLEHAGEIVDLLAYDEDTAGGLMAKELIKVNEAWDIETCIREIKKEALDIEDIYNVYVVDDNDILKGTVTLKRVLVARPNARIRNMYKPDLLFVHTDTSSEDVARMMEKYDVVALPVVDSIGRLVGRVTIDDVVDVIKEEAERDYQLISGITGDVEPSDNVFILTRARLPWLFIGMAGSLVAAQIISNFENEIRIDPRLAIFVPLIAAMGGNVGVQSSSIVVQGLANKSINFESTWRRVLKEFSVALIIAVTFSSLVLAYNLIFSHTLELTLTVSSALFSVILFASVFGTFIPLTLNRFKIDPAVATGPFITTTNDVLGLFIYFGLGRLLYGMLA